MVQWIIDSFLTVEIGRQMIGKGWLINHIVHLELMVELILEKMKKVLLLSLCFIFLSCITSRNEGHSYVSVYKRVNNRNPNVKKNFLIFKHSPQTFESYIYTDGGHLGIYSIADDTLTLYNKYAYHIEHKKIVMIELDSSDYFLLCPRTFLIRKDSLIDITCYPNPAPDFNIDFSSKKFRVNYVLETKKTHKKCF